jgi:hypothetical protein
MLAFGPVAEAARGGQTTPSFDLLVGFAVLGMTWFGYRRKKENDPRALWISLAISIICGIFIFDGIRLALR